MLIDAQATSDTKCCTEMLRVLQDWLLDRFGTAIVSGCQSKMFSLRNMVFQGTVIGPTLRDAFFAGVALQVRRCGFQEIMFADDLSAHRAFASDTPLEFMMSQLQRVQSEVHLWGPVTR